MKRAILIAAAAVLLLGGVRNASAADAVVPESCSVTNLRGEAQGKVGTADFYRGASILLTNCVLYAGTSTNSARQGLDGVTVECRIGAQDLSTAYTGTVDVASNGTWFATVAAPTNSSSAWLQIKITDGSGNSYIYPWKTITTLDPLD